MSSGSFAIGLGAVFALVLANAFFVATEFAIVAVRRSRIEQLAKQGSAAARAAREVVTHLDAYIAACQFGITLSSLGLGWVGEPVLARWMEPWFAGLSAPWAAAAAHTIAIGIAFSVITALHIVAGELAPKGIALQRPESTTLLIAFPIQWFYRLFRWPINGLNAVGNGVLRLLGFEATAGHENVHSVEELRYLLRASHEAGVVEESEARIASRAFRFADRTARELMTPRTRVAAVPADLKGPELLERARASGFTRLPVYEKTLDEIVGILNVRDLLAQPNLDARALARPALSVPVTRKADDLLEDMRVQTATSAIVVDEFGGTAGLITLHDLLEGLVGPLRKRGTPAEIQPPGADGSRLVAGTAPLAEVEEATGLRFSEQDRLDADTLSGALMSRLGRLPQRGDEVTIDGRTLRVIEIDERRIPLLRLAAPDVASNDSASD